MITFFRKNKTEERKKFTSNQKYIPNLDFIYAGKIGFNLYLIFEDKAHQFSQSVKKAAVAFEEARITK